MLVTVPAFTNTLVFYATGLNYVSKKFYDTDPWPSSYSITKLKVADPQIYLTLNLTNKTNFNFNMIQLS